MSPSSVAKASFRRRCRRRLRSIIILLPCATCRAQPRVFCRKMKTKDTDKNTSRFAYSRYVVLRSNSNNLNQENLAQKYWMHFPVPAFFIPRRPFPAGGYPRRHEPQDSGALEGAGAEAEAQEHVRGGGGQTKWGGEGGWGRRQRQSQVQRRGGCGDGCCRNWGKRIIARRLFRSLSLSTCFHTLSPPPRFIHPLFARGSSLFSILRRLSFRVCVHSRIISRCLLLLLLPLLLQLPYSISCPFRLLKERFGLVHTQGIQRPHFSPMI